MFYSQTSITDKHSAFSAETHELQQWLRKIEQIHPGEIELTLERVSSVARTMGLIALQTECSHEHSGPLASGARVITVAGTNGKGSCVATLQALLLTQRRSDGSPVRVGAYTSPHLQHFCERICIQGKPVEDAKVCEAFEAIEQARGLVSLTYFEFATLAALVVFARSDLDYVILEVGLGGRLDAVNCVDSDMAVLTSIDLDHQQWLGDERESISQEKLGVVRAQRPLILTEERLTPSLEVAIGREQTLWVQRDFYWRIDADRNLVFQIKQNAFSIPLPSLPCASVVAALVVIQVLKIELSEYAISDVLKGLRLPGRLESISIQGLKWVFDVAHNPAAVRLLAGRLKDQLLSEVPKCSSKTFAIFAAMADKDLDAMVQAMDGHIDRWFIANLTAIPRAVDTNTLSEILRKHQQAYERAASLEIAISKTIEHAAVNDRILVFGSFYTVAGVKAFLLR